MRVLAAYNIKGGVGKTTTAVNLAFVAASEGFRTLVWDLDPLGAASFCFRIKPKIKGGGKALLRRERKLDSAIKGTDYEGLDLIPADFSYRKMDLALGTVKKPMRQLAQLSKPLAKAYDYLFLDCAPSISLVSENVFRTADALLVPMIPTTLSLRTYQQLLRHLDKHGLKDLRLLTFFSMVDRRRRLHREILETLPLRYPNILATDIPYASQVERMGLERAPLGDYAADSMAAKAYASLWNEIVQRV